MGIGLRVALIVCFIVIIFGVHMIADGRSAEPYACARSLPTNITLDRDLERMLATIYRASRTFRAQCDQIGATSTLSVTLKIDIRIPRSCEAFTRFSRRGHELYADVHLPPSGAMMPRLVGHEFEHIIEQLDGLNLRTLARVAGSGVYQSSPEMYETNRAQRAGLLVANEAYSPRRAD